MYWNAHRAVLNKSLLSDKVRNLALSSALRALISQPQWLSLPRLNINTDRCGDICLCEMYGVGWDDGDVGVPI